jgi:hypothetical protein
MKNFLMIAAIAVASLSAAGSKSYEITLDTATQAGKTELKAGHYRVKVKGDVAEFLNIGSSKTVSVPVKVETTNSKFSMTAVDTKNENGVSSIESIELRDTNSKLAF